jgi:hypothetical protein
MRKRIAILCGVLLLSACGTSHHYRFTPEESRKDGDPYNVECGIVSYRTTKNFSGRSTEEAVGYFCKEPE